MQQHEPGLLKVAFVVPATQQAVTGPRNSVTRLAAALNGYGIAQAEVFTSRGYETFRFNDVDVRPVGEADFSAFDIVVFSGVWLPAHIKLARVLRREGIPYVVSPRSSLMKTQFRKSPHKKIPFMALGGYQYLNRAAAIHFLSDDERRNSQFNKKSFVVSNMLDEHSSTLRSEKTDRINKVFGFLGRYSVDHKGLDLLLDACREVAPLMREQGWQLRLHGSDNRGEQVKLETFITTHQLTDIVKLGGPLHGASKTAFLCSVDVFIHTSRYEGQPQAVMEAMAQSCAILVTPGTNMSSPINEAACGLLSKLTARDIAEALRGYMLGKVNLPAQKLQAAIYAREYYSPQSVAAAFADELEVLLKK